MKSRNKHYVVTVAIATMDQSMCRHRSWINCPPLCAELVRDRMGGSEILDRYQSYCSGKGKLHYRLSVRLTISQYRPLPHKKIDRLNRQIERANAKFDEQFTYLLIVHVLGIT